MTPVAGNPWWWELAASGHVGDEKRARAALAHSDPVARTLALGALDRLGELDDLVVVAFLVDPDAEVRRRAITIAARRPHVSLLQALDDDDATVVETAAWACGEQATDDDATMERLIELASGSNDPLVREACVASLGAIGKQRGLQAILAGCADKPAVRRRAVLALAPFDGPEVEAALHHALSDRDWQVRQSAEDVLRAAGGDAHPDDVTG